MPLLIQNTDLTLNPCLKSIYYNKFRQFCVRPPNGVGSQSPSCLLPIFDPDGVRKNPLDFSSFCPARFLKRCL